MEKIHATANVGSRSGRPFYAAVVGQWRQPIATADVYSDYVQEALNCLRYDVSGTHLSSRPNGPPNFVRPSSVLC